MDPDRRRELYFDLQEELWNEGGYILHSFAKRPDAARNNVGGMRTGVPGTDDWANYANGKKDPGQNPKYCYDWAFVEPGIVVVLNLWFELMQEREGVIWQDLDRNKPVQVLVACLIDSAHSAFADLRDDLVMQQALANHRLAIISFGRGFGHSRKLFCIPLILKELSPG